MGLILIRGNGCWFLIKVKILEKEIEIKKAIFFPEDFRKLPKGVVIYIEKGKLISIKGKQYRIVEK